jgi:hypothetical protein
MLNTAGQVLVLGEKQEGHLPYGMYLSIYHTLLRGGVTGQALPSLTSCHTQEQHEHRWLLLMWSRWLLQ